MKSFSFVSFLESFNVAKWREKGKFFKNVRLYDKGMEKNFYFPYIWLIMRLWGKRIFGNKHHINVPLHGNWEFILNADFKFFQ